MLLADVVAIAFEGRKGFAFASAIVSRFFCLTFQVGYIGENA
jgi:hypothetical protein